MRLRQAIAPIAALLRREQPLSLKFKLIGLTVGLFAAFLWVMATVSATVLERQFEKVLSDQQFAATRQIAAEIDAKLDERVESLAKVAAAVPQDLDAATLDAFLQRFPALHVTFAAGITVIGLEGRAIADYPVAPGRRGTYYGDRDYVRKVVETGRPYIDKPIIGRALKRPVLAIAVPVTDAGGALRAVLTGITDLSAPNFLGIVSQPEMAGKGEIFIVSPHDKLVIAATDQTRAMTTMSERGRNQMLDRFIDGFEGSGISTNSAGIAKLYSAKRVARSNWIVMSALRADVAFGPVAAMRNSLYIAAGIMTLVAIFMIQWLARRMLAPLDRAGAAMRSMIGGEAALAPLPGENNDEIGHLITSFNLLVEDRHRYEQAMKDSEQNLRKLNRALRMLSDCNMTLVHAEREQSLLDEICRLVVFRGGYRMAWVGYAEHDEPRSVRPVSQSGFDDGYLEQLRISWSDASEYGRGPTGTAIRESRVQIVQNYMDNPLTGPWREAARMRGYQSSIALPLISAGRTFGALSIYSADPDSFGQDEVRLLYELASDLAFGIETLRTRSQHVMAEEKLAFLAHHDTLTRLPNRVLLRDRFDRATALSGRDRSGVAVLVLDLDNFKQVNDGLGHETGDKLLLAIVERLQRCIRESDTISRQGGDEFLILLDGVSDSGAVSRMAQSILDAAAEPFEIGGHTVNTSFSIGISLCPEDGTDFDTLIKNANTALYHAKDNGRDTYHFFAASMNVNALARMELHGSLRKAVKNNEFVLHYQPQIDIVSGTIVGMEALVRWRRGDEGLVPPGRFIALAEESGLIVPIGEWVLNEACRQAAAWQRAGLPALPVAVNLSAQQFKRGGILDTVRSALRQSGLHPSLLELELTESLLLNDTATVMETLHELKKIGVLLSIDDFGTGYSSLAYLKRLDVDKLKIDQSFVRDVPGAAEGAAIVKAIIQLGHALQLTVIAEGVETQAQLDFLHAHGCDQAQGYLVSRPVPAEAFAELAAELM